MSNSILEKELFNLIEEKTPEYIKKTKLLDIDNKESFVFQLKKEHLYPYDELNNPYGLNLYEWFKNYKKEASVSTAGVRGPQNILYPSDTRFPINMVGIALATLAKALVAKEKYPDKTLVKIAGREVRYNSDKYLDLITRIQAANGIKTLVACDKTTMPIWLASFLAFKLDLLGGEYITSSHGISVKNATKDLNSQGSQYLPDESLEFVNKIEEIFNKVEKDGVYDIEISEADNEHILEEKMCQLNNGIDLYKEYLESGVATPDNIDQIKKLKNKIIIDNVGGSAYLTLSKLLEKFSITKNFDWLNISEDPFFHGIGKYEHDPKGNKCFYDYSVDATVIARDQNNNKYFPVIKTLYYEEKLKKYPLYTVVLITDPDHDRLTVCQIEPIENIDFLNELGVDYQVLDESRVLSVYTANQSFLLIMDYCLNRLKEQKLFEKYPRFIIKTTASAKSWDEWANFNNINVVNVPVGFKEIANVMKKVEKQISDFPDKDVHITDVLNKDINLGKTPRLLFAGEESGGMILGVEDFINSQNGRKAIAMREKSATEAIFAASALVAKLEEQNISLSQHLKNVFEKNQIIAKYDLREDISYYNESEPDIVKMKQEKLIGEEKRTKNDIFYLTLAISFYQNKIKLPAIKEIFSFTFPELNFENLLDIKFVGDGTYLEFDNKFIEIRPSGTDAKTKAYGAGANKEELEVYTKILGNFSGELNDIYLKYINVDDYKASKDISMKYYLDFTNKDANNEEFCIPDYKKLLNNCKVL